MSNNRNPSAGAKRAKKRAEFKRQTKSGYEAFKASKMKEDIQKALTGISKPSATGIKRHKKTVRSYAALIRTAKQRRKHLAKQPK